ncbi:MAG: hypothetical protein ACD_54C00818G0001, partial [uncultured bacterium]
MQKIAHQPCHPFGLARHDRQKPLTRGGIIARRALQGFDEAQQRGQWRAQFVADVGDKIAAHLIHLLFRCAVLERAKDALRPRRDADIV